MERTKFCEHQLEAAPCQLFFSFLLQIHNPHLNGGLFRRSHISPAPALPPRPTVAGCSQRGGGVGVRVSVPSSVGKETFLLFQRGG